MPQSVDPLTTRLHQPPRIPLASIDVNLLPPVLMAFQKGPSDLLQHCSCPLKLALPVEEDDTSADLEARWFIDYDTSNFSSTGIVLTNPLPGSLANVTIRSGAAFTVEPDSLATGLHVIDMVVAEQTGFVASSTLPNRAVRNSDGYQAAEYRFVIDVRASPNPSCPDALPAGRTCPL